MDTVSPDQRSRNMAAIKGKNTKPELRVRRFLHQRGLRYRLHVPDLPGTPDLVFRAKRAVVFVHGCFWHRCPHCRAGSRRVKSNTGYWLAKLKRNQARDAEATTALKATGWKVFIVWECQVNNKTTLARLAKALMFSPDLVCLALPRSRLVLHSQSAFRGLQSALRPSGPASFGFAGSWPDAPLLSPQPLFEPTLAR